MGAQVCPNHNFGPESEPVGAALTLPAEDQLCLWTPRDPHGTGMDKPHRVGAPTLERANGYQDGYQS